MTPRQFYGLARGYPVNALGATVQTCHETGGYKHVPNNNFAGIKFRPWLTKLGAKPSSPLLTWEVIGGKRVQQHDCFAAFSSPPHFLECYTHMIRSFPRYQLAEDNRDCVWGFYAGLVKGGWATDPNYFKALVHLTVRLAPELLGGTWRDTLQNSFAAARERKVLQGWQTVMIQRALP